MAGGGGPKPNAEETPALDHITLQSSAYGQPVPIVYGTQRVPGNVIWYDEFTPTRHEHSQEVGKGGSTEVTSVDYTYTACVQMAICGGPVASFGRVWRDKECKPSPGSVGFEANSLGPRHPEYLLASVLPVLRIPIQPLSNHHGWEQKWTELPFLRGETCSGGARGLLLPRADSPFTRQGSQVQTLLRQRDFPEPGSR